MSDYSLKLIPKNPYYIPNTDSQINSILFIKKIYDKNEVVQNTTDNIEFIDCGENFEKVTCPNCGQTLDMDLWGQIMSSLYEKHFSEPIIALPCCCTTCKIYDLNYTWDCGFSKFVIQISNPEKDLNKSELSELEKIIGCELKVIRVHI